MHTLTHVVACAFLLVLAAPVRSDDEKEKATKAEELKKLQGKWKIVSAEFAGKAMEVKQIGIDRIVVAGEKMTLKNGDKDVAAYTFEVSPDRKPKGLVWTREKDKGMLPVIYETDGAKLKLCFPLPSTTPPKEPFKFPGSFDTKGKPLGLVVAEREKK